MKYVLTYGIACVEERGGRKEPLAEIHGVTTNRNEAEHLVRLCNEKELSPEHLADVVDDLIATV